MKEDSVEQVEHESGVEIPQAGGSAERGRRPSGVEPPRRGDTTHRYSLEERKRLLAELESSSETQAAFCARHRVSTATICAWKKLVRLGGDGALAPRENSRNRDGKSGRVHSPEERGAAIDAFDRSGLSVDSFARAYGVAPWTLRYWIRRYREDGAKGLEPKKRGRKKGSGNLRRIPQSVREEIARTKRRFPDFGLKKVRDFLRRFQGIGVSTGSIARTLEEAGIEPLSPSKKRRRSSAKPRRFERSRPGELWQSDITSFVLPRPGRRVYLVVFLDDFSRFVVSFGLHLAMRSGHVSEVLLEGIARFGKPLEVLTDQGPQYFTWRGKSGFQKVLDREGIRHVVARSHHPQTLGKCERLWETVGQEFWERARPSDLADARSRLGHYFAHYNFFRPHQGIEGAVPADRFFGAEQALRQTIEAQLSRRELEEAIEEAPRRSVYLFGQIGDEQVSVVGERGELFVQTSSGVRQRLGLDELGAPAMAQEKEHDGHAIERNREQDRDQTAPLEQETPEVRPSPALPARSEGALDECVQGGAGACAPSLHPDPFAVAGQTSEEGCRRIALDPAAASLAAVPAGALGDARRAPPSASSTPTPPGGDDGTARGRSEETEEAHRRSGAADRRSAGADPALDEHPQAPREVVGEHGGADEGNENARQASGGQA